MDLRLYLAARYQPRMEKEAFRTVEQRVRRGLNRPSERVK